jgi:glycosyltransferase involved in cell wall biosynthesis
MTMATVLFDVTRLYMRASLASPTGIDRVTEAYGRWLLSRPDVRVIPVCTIGGPASTLSLGDLKRLLGRERPVRPGTDGDWRRLSDALAGPPGGTPTLRAAPGGSLNARAPVRYGMFGARAVASWRPAAFGPDAIYLNVSHFGLEQPRVLERLTARGVRPAAMIHDLIPIVHPEYCSAPAAGWHLKRVQTLLRHRALIIANSKSTAEELRTFAAVNGLAAPDICVAPLGLEPVFAADPGSTAQARPYFVCVGTIEPRKNVAFLLTLWRSLAERMGEETPWLVLAGRRGWENEAIIDHLERSPPIQRFVHEVSDLQDAQLAALIAGASALLAPSFAEGFNLPVAEAAALGTPVIASDISVHRELALHARLLDPTDGPAWLGAIEAAARSRARGGDFTPFTWPEHFAAVGKALGLPDR